MATLCIRSFPKYLHDEIRRRAKENHRSISEEVILIVREEMRKRQDAIKRLSGCRFTSTSKGKMPDSLDLIREDRER
jgi:plasmid stability protein